jgi:hypothetical protein
MKNSQRLLVCMRDGNVYEIELSAQAKFDTTKSYLIESKVKMRKYTFKSIKSRLRVNIQIFLFHCAVNKNIHLKLIEARRRVGT